MCRFLTLEVVLTFLNQGPRVLLLLFGEGAYLKHLSLVFRKYSKLNYKCFRPVFNTNQKLSRISGLPSVILNMFSSLLRVLNDFFQVALF